MGWGTAVAAGVDTARPVAVAVLAGVGVRVGGVMMRLLVGWYEGGIGRSQPARRTVMPAKAMTIAARSG